MVEIRKEPIKGVTAYIKKMADGSYVTQTRRDGVIVKEEPTHPSQIRRERESLVWRIDEASIMSKPIKNGVLQ